MCIAAPAYVLMYYDFYSLLFLLVANNIQGNTIIDIQKRRKKYLYTIKMDHEMANIELDII